MFSALFGGSPFAAGALEFEEDVLGTPLALEDDLKRYTAAANITTPVTPNVKLSMLLVDMYRVRRGIYINSWVYIWLIG